MEFITQTYLLNSEKNDFLHLGPSNLFVSKTIHFFVLLLFSLFFYCLFLYRHLQTSVGLSPFRFGILNACCHEKPVPVIVTGQKRVCGLLAITCVERLDETGNRRRNGKDCSYRVRIIDGFLKIHTFFSLRWLVCNVYAHITLVICNLSFLKKYICLKTRCTCSI